MSKLTSLISTPTYSTVVPSTGQKINFRPFVVKEERALLMAQEAEDTDAMLNTLDAIVHACIQTELKMPLSTFDIEYLFVQIRIKSVEEFSTLVFGCSKCEEKTPIQLDLKKVEVFYDPAHTKTITLGEDLVVDMQYPGIHDLIGDNSSTQVLAKCLYRIFKGDAVENASDYTTEEVVEFLDNLSSQQYEKIEEFFSTIPETRLNLKWTCPKCGHQHDQTLRGLDSFF
jgi:ribosomal protein L44E